MAVSQSNAAVDMNISGPLMENGTKSVKLSKRYCQILVNVSMLNILYRRSGCINPGELKCKEIRGTEFVTLKAGRDPEDPVLKYLMFVLKGIKNAIAKGFLREIHLVLKHPQTLVPLEIYTIAVKYNTTGVIKDDLPNLRDSTLMVLKHIRNLDKFTQLPRYTKVKVELTYNENTPASYQPPGFHAAVDAVCLKLEKKRVVFGMLNTGFHKLIYSARGEEIVENLNKIYNEEDKPGSQDDPLDDAPLSKRMKLDNATNKQASQPEQTDPVPGTSADPDPSPNTGTPMDIEEQNVIDENMNLVDSPKSINPLHSISLISSDESDSVIETPVTCSLDSISCICQVDTAMFTKGRVDEKEIERIACDRCKRTYHLPCHGYLAQPIMREFFCVKCSPYNTTDTIIRNMEGEQLRIFCRCRLLLYLMHKSGKPQDDLLALFPSTEQTSLMERFVKYDLMNRKNQVNVMKIQRSANIIFNLEDSQFLY